MLTKNNKWFLLTLLSLIWGSSFILIKKGLIGLNPFQLGALRIIFAALFLLVVGRKSLSFVPKKKWKYIALTSVLGTGLPAFLFAYAETGLPSGITGILNSLTPLYTLLIGFFLFGLVFRSNQILGVLLGMTGCFILVFNSNNAAGETNYFYVSLVVIATICYAINTNVVKKHLSNISPLSIVTGNFVVLLVPALLILLSSNFTQIVTQAEVQHAILFIIVLGMLGTGVANILYFQLIQITSPLFASSVTYFIPIVAMGWGLIDHERLNLFQIIGTIVILSGVYMASKK